MTLEELEEWLLRREKPTVILAPTHRGALRGIAGIAWVELTQRFGRVDFDQIPWRNLVDALGKHLAKPKAILWTNSPAVFDRLAPSEAFAIAEPGRWSGESGPLEQPLAEMIFSGDGFAFRQLTAAEVEQVARAYNVGIQQFSECIEAVGGLFS